MPSFDQISEASFAVSGLLIDKAKRDNHKKYDPARHTEITKKVFDNIYAQLRQWLADDITDQSKKTEGGE